MSGSSYLAAALARSKQAPPASLHFHFTFTNNLPLRPHMQSDAGAGSRLKQRPTHPTTTPAFPPALTATIPFRHRAPRPGPTPSSRLRARIPASDSSSQPQHRRPSARTRRLPLAHSTWKLMATPKWQRSPVLRHCRQHHTMSPNLRPKPSPMQALNPRALSRLQPPRK